MKKLFSLLFALLASLAVVTPVLAAPMTYGSGEYTNLCGGGYAADRHACSGECNPTTGTCTAQNPYVISFTCDGKLGKCGENASASTWSQNLAGTTCGKTKGIVVYTKNCTATGKWDCADNEVKDYMVWYSGDCPAGTPTPIAANNLSSCDQLAVVSGAMSFVPATVTLRARGSDNAGNLTGYRFYFGDGTGQETTNAEIQHKYTSSGQYTARVDIKDSQGVWKTAPACETRFTVLGSPLESQKSMCSDLFVTSGNNTGAPATVTFRLNGYDNKGGIKRYKMDFGNGVTKESDSGSFEQTYDQAGTYTAKGYVQDSKGAWLGGSESCEKAVYVNTKPLTTQPATGAPTLLTLLGLGAGVSAGMLYLFSVLKPHHLPKRKKVSPRR